MFICEVCKREFETKMALCGHKRIHTKKFRSSYIKNRKKSKSILNHECKYCNKIFFSGVSLGGHINWCSLNPHREKHIKKIRESSGMGGKNHSKETKDKLRAVAVRNHLGGHTSKKALYYKQVNGNVVYLQSSYEITVAKELDNHGVEWTRPKPFFWDDNGTRRRYYPDFYLPSYNCYLDPKNDFLIRKDKRKIDTVIKENKIKLYILDSNHLSYDQIVKVITPV